jgi:GNAT superfamily N-acetyltransferase
MTRSLTPPTILALGELPSTGSVRNPDTPNLSSMLSNVRDWWGLPGNRDVGENFPDLVAHYLMPPFDEAQGRMLQNQYEAQRNPFEYQLFAPHILLKDVQVSGPHQGLTAVGLGCVRLAKPREIPPLIEPETPEVSAVIFAPFRGNGIGRALLNHCLEYVDEYHDGLAWATIRSRNERAQTFAVQAGFTFVSQELRDGALRSIYRYISK